MWGKKTWLGANAVIYTHFKFLVGPLDDAKWKIQLEDTLPKRPCADQCGDMSKRWSCGTLEEGYQHVMADAMADIEDDIMKQIQDSNPW